MTKAALAIVFSGAKVNCSSTSQIEPLDDKAVTSLKMLVTELSAATCVTNDTTLRLTANFVPNAAIQPDSIIAPIQANTPLLFEWKHTLYVLYGVVYDERVHSNGWRENVIRELLLIDPRYPDKHRLVAFDRLKDNFAEVEGVASVSVTH